jgi:hypothetical protein
MKKIIIGAVCACTVICSQCKEAINEDFLISNDRVGKIERSDNFGELEAIFEKDSLVIDSLVTKVGGRPDRARVYEKGGKHLLTITTASDSMQQIENIRVLDPRYTTTGGIGLGSTFKDVREHYRVRKVVTSLNNVVVFLKGQDFYITLSREELPANLRYNRGIQVEEVQIPGQARIKYLMVGWD